MCEASGGEDREEDRRDLGRTPEEREDQAEQRKRIDRRLRIGVRAQHAGGARRIHGGEHNAKTRRVLAIDRRPGPSLADVAIASALAMAGIAMAPLPIGVIVVILAAAGAFALVLAAVKVAVFTRLGIG